MGEKGGWDLEGLPGSTGTVNLRRTSVSLVASLSIDSVMLQ